MIYHTYTCSVCSYSRRKLTYRPGTREIIYEPRDDGHLNGYAGETFDFASMEELRQGIRDLFAPGSVSFHDYGEFIAVVVMTDAHNRAANTRALMDAFHAGKCCQWEYTLYLSDNDGSLTGFPEGEGMAHIPKDKAALEKAAALPAAVVTDAWRIIRRERGAKPGIPWDDAMLDFIMLSMAWTHRNVPRLREAVAALRPYDAATYPTPAEAYADMFGCTPERAREREEYDRLYCGDGLLERIRQRGDVRCVNLGRDGRVYVMRNA